jgi:hypothetical protein
MAGGTRRTRRRAPALWGIHSVSVRVRDGPQRLEQIYRLLVVEPVPPAAGGARPPCSPRSWYRPGCRWPWSTR